MGELNTLTVTELIALRPPPSSTELLEGCLAQIHARDSEVRAFTHVAWERALADARVLDDERGKGRTRSPLHGIAVAIKDILDTRGMPTAYGSPIWRKHRPAHDASCVRLLRDAGAVIIGKTVTAELAFTDPGPTRNPHNLMHTPGGSSQGSAAAVADLMVPLALGTQTAGSVIRPASFCGVVGYKPTFNWIERSGLRFFSQSLDTIGIMARSVPDVALAASVLANRSLFPLQPLEAPPRVGVCRSPAWDRADDVTKTHLAEATTRLQEAGARVSSVELPAACDGLLDAQRRIAGFEAARSLSHELREYPALLSEDLRALLREGAVMPPEEYAAARVLQDQCVILVDEIWTDVDILVTPSATGEAPRGLGSTGDPSFNAIWTVVGTPCVTVPAFRGPAGLPIGLQVVGRRHRDLDTLAAAEWVRRALA